jgi:hypothetical protein
MLQVFQTGQGVTLKEGRKTLLFHVLTGYFVGLAHRHFFCPFNAFEALPRINPSLNT